MLLFEKNCINSKIVDKIKINILKKLILNTNFSFEFENYKF